MSSIIQVNKTVDPDLFSKLRMNQLVCRPSGTLFTQKALQTQSSQTFVNTSKAENTLNTELSLQEKECLSFRFKYFSGLGITFSTQQEEINTYLKSISKGLYNPQLNGLQLLFCQLFINKKDLSVQFSSYTTLSVTGENVKLTDMIDRANQRLLLMMCLTQYSLQYNNPIHEDLIGGEIDAIRGFLQLFPPELLKGSKSITGMHNGLNILAQCIKNKGKLFPLLLQPVDHFHLQDTNATQAELLALSEPKLLMLSNSASFLCEGIKNYMEILEEKQNTINKLLKEKHLKELSELKFSFTQFQLTTKKIESLFKAAQELAELGSNPLLLTLEEKICSQGPQKCLQLLEELNASEENFVTLYSEFIQLFQQEKKQFLKTFEPLKTNLKSKNSFKEISEILDEIGTKFDYFIKTPLSTFRKLLPATIDIALVDLKKTCSFFQSMKQQLPIVNSASCHIRWIDVFTISVLNPLLEDTLTTKNEILPDLVTSLFAFSNDVNHLRKIMSSSGEKGYLNLAKHISENQHNLCQVNETLPDPKIYHLNLLKDASFNSQDFRFSLSFSTPLFHYPTLTLPLGNIGTIDQTLLDFFNKTIETAKTYAENSINVINLFAENNTSLSKEMCSYADQWIDFFRKTIELLSKPLSSQQDIAELSDLLRSHFNQYPPIPEQLVDALEDNRKIEDSAEGHIVDNAFGDFRFLKTSLLSALLSFESRTKKSRAAKEQKSFPKISHIEIPNSEVKIQGVPKASMEEPSKLEESPIKAIGFMSFSQTLQTNLRSLDEFKLYSSSGKEQEIILRNDRISTSLENMHHHLSSIQSLCLLPGLSYLQIESLQRANALLIECALNYVFAFREVKDSVGKHVAVSTEVSHWQHQLLEMVRLCRSSGQEVMLSKREEEFLQNVSSMLSKMVNPSHFSKDSRIKSLQTLRDSLGSKQAEEMLKSAALASYEESALAMQICDRLLFPKGNNNNSSENSYLVNFELPKNFTVATHSKYHNTLIEGILGTYHQLAEKMQDSDHTVRVPGEPLLQYMFRDQLVARNFQDIAFHLDVAKEGLAILETKSATFSEVNTLFLHLSLSVEKSLKIMTLILPIPSDNNNTNQAGQHVLFEIMNNRPRRYDHHLERNATLLQSALPESMKLNLSNDSLLVIQEFADFIGELIRYPSGKTGTIANMMRELKILNILMEKVQRDSLTLDEEVSMEHRCGKNKPNWEKTLQTQLQSLQSNELLPRARALLSATDTLLRHATLLIH